MLEEKLMPLLAQLRAGEIDPQARFEIVRARFKDYEENLAESLEDMAFVCELPNNERTLLTYPIMGNWFLDRMAAFNPQTEHQARAYALLRDLVREIRFNNYHTRSFYSDNEYFNRKLDEFYSALIRNPPDGPLIYNMLKRIYRDVADAVRNDGFPKRQTYTIDLPHGLIGPANEFCSSIFFDYEAAQDIGDMQPIDLTIMVVDDQKPEQWYQRLISAGFKHAEGQQGFFYDCESALAALKTGNYDVVLSDLEFGRGQMGGIEFAERAYEIQKQKGIEPRISVFSYSDEMLRQAYDQLHQNGIIFFCDRCFSNKINFTAMKFRISVGGTL